MRAVVLEYHDVVGTEPPGNSGFPGASADSYKVDERDFRAHLAAVSDAGCPVVNDVRNLAAGEAPNVPVLFTFDDGGASAMRSADLLEAHGWRGHYFIASSCIGATGFLGGSELRDLHSRGHIVGSHSHTHPLQMGRMTPGDVRDEWERSVEALAAVLGLTADVASVPGGYYRPFIAELAAESGIAWLFTSEPVRQVARVAGTAVLGRYTIRRTTSEQQVRALTAPRSLARVRQWTTWNAKKVAKRIGGNAYLRVRAAIFRENSHPTGDPRPGTEQ